MDPDDVLTSILDKATGAGVKALTKGERTLYYVNVFLIDCDNGSLSGFLYNACHDDTGSPWHAVEETIKALRTLQEDAAAAALERAFELVTGAPMSPDCTWEQYLAKADRSSELDTLASELSELSEDLWERLEGAASSLAAANESD
jgi:hypothetical protein